MENRNRSDAHQLEAYPNSLTEIKAGPDFANKGMKSLNNKCRQKQIEKLCQYYSKETGTEFTSYCDPKFLAWLEKSNPSKVSKNYYTIIETSKFAQAIMDAYMASMNEVSEKLDNQISKEVYSKQEVIEIVFDAFNSAKTIGEAQITKPK